MMMTMMMMMMMMNAFVRCARLNWEIFDIKVFSFSQICFFFFRLNREVARGMVIYVSRSETKIISRGDFP